MRLYLDTSVWSFLFVEDAPDKRKSTEKLMEEIAHRKHEAFISEIVLQEIQKTRSGPLRGLLIERIRRVDPIMLEDPPGAEAMAERFVRERIVPRKDMDDAIHMATALLAGTDALVSWNLRHMVKHRTRLFVRALALLKGMREMDIVTPEEVIESDEG